MHTGKGHICNIAENDLSPFLYASAGAVTIAISWIIFLLYHYHNLLGFLPLSVSFSHFGYMCFCIPAASPLLLPRMHVFSVVVRQLV